MRAIFISYRRDDTEGHAGRLFEDLCDRFGKDAVFMDVAGLEAGRDFRRAIEQQIASCGVLLAVIGKNWLTVADAQGRRRLDDPYDFVRLETAGALKRDIPVIPVLVHQAEMPHAEDLPDDLKDLAFRNGVELAHARWASDVKLLIAALMPYVDETPPPPAPPPPSAPFTRRSPAWLIAPLGALAAGGIAYVVWDRFPSSPEAPSVTASAPARVPSASAVDQAPAVAPPIAAASRPGEPRPESAVAAEKEAPVRVAAETPAPSPAPTPKRVDKSVVVRAPAPTPAPAPRPVYVAPSNAPAPAAVTAMASPTPAPAPATRTQSLPEARTPEVAVAAAPNPGSDQVGIPGAASMATRTITIGSDTKYVNVTGGEVIRFQVGARSFVWNFIGTRSSFDLSRIAPPATLDHKVTAYVAPNPMYPKK
jgi:Heavy-metal resistance protein CzcE/TIR domain